MTLQDHGEHMVEALVQRLDSQFEVTTTPLFNGDGSYAATVHVARDITERKRYEAELSWPARLQTAPIRPKVNFWPI